MGTSRIVHVPGSRARIEVLSLPVNCRAWEEGAQKTVSCKRSTLL